MHIQRNTTVHNQAAEPLVVRLFHRSRTAILEYQHSGLGLVYWQSGYRFRVMESAPETVLDRLPLGPYRTSAELLAAAWRVLQSAPDAPGYVAIVTQSPWHRQAVTLAPRLIEDIPVITIQAGALDQPCFRIAGHTATGAPILAPSFFGPSNSTSRGAQACPSYDLDPAGAGRLHAAVMAETLRQGDLARH